MRRSTPSLGSPYRDPPLAVQTKPRYGVALVVMVAGIIVASSACCIIVTESFRLDEGPSVRPHSDFASPAMFLGIVAAMAALYASRIVPARGWMVLLSFVAALPLALAAVHACRAQMAQEWKQGCEQVFGNAADCRDYALANNFAMGVRRDPAEAQRYLRRACVLGDRVSCDEVWFDDSTATAETPSDSLGSPPRAVNQRTELDTLLTTLDEDPDPPHADITPSVSRLCELGLAGLGAALDRLDAPQALTRLHAQRVVECVVMRRAGWLPGRGYASREAEDGVRALLARNGGYGYEAPVEKRRASIARWRAWLRVQNP